MKKILIYSIVFIMTILSQTGITVSAETVAVSLDNCDSAQNFTEQVYSDNTGYVEGKASIADFSANTAIHCYLQDLDTGVLPERSSAYLDAYIYISNTALIKEGQFELNSSGINDLDELTLDIQSMGLENGWNHISISMASNLWGNTGGTFIYSNLRAFRFYVISKTDEKILTRLDDIKITNAPVNIPKEEITELSAQRERLGLVQNTRIYGADENTVSGGCNSELKVSARIFSTAVLLLLFYKNFKLKRGNHEKNYK